VLQKREAAVSDHVKLERKGGLLVLTLANPDGNRIGLGLLTGLRAALVEVRKPVTRAVLVKGEGAVFSYGADVKEFAARPANELFALLQDYIDILGQLEASGVPTLAAVHGVCSSGGLELALAFDQLWAAAGTKIGFLEANIAVPPLAGGVQRIAARAGQARAFEIATAGQLYEVDQFERWNIVNRILPGETLEAEAEAFAAKWAVGPTRAFAGVKTLLREWDRTGVIGADKITIATIAPIMEGRDAKAAIQASMAGRVNQIRPTFIGS
jgi:enoyl-CoA hydratase/carnithine racemase